MSETRRSSPELQKKIKLNEFFRGRFYDILKGCEVKSYAADYDFSKYGISKIIIKCVANVVFEKSDVYLDKDNFDRVVILSGDGDFLPVLKYLKSISKEVLVLARGERTAREFRQFSRSNFRDFERLRAFVGYREK